MSWNFALAKLVCRMWLGVGQNWFCNHRAVILSLAELALCVYPFSFSLFIPAAAVAASNPVLQKHKANTQPQAGERSFPQRAVSEQRSDQAGVCQTWFLISLRAGNYRLTTNIIMFSVKGM